MTEVISGGVMRRKITASKAALAEGGPGADRGWRLALARAARDRLSMALDVTALSIHNRSLAELLEMPPLHALIAVLQGPADCMGLLVLSPTVLAAMTEAMTLGKVATAPLVTRRPTRTDAAMVADTLDTALEGLDAVLAQEADLIWAGGFRYASFLDDPRPLGLLLEDIEYRVISTEVSLGHGARAGAILLALPAEGRGQHPALPFGGQKSDENDGPVFAQALASQVEEANCILDAVLSKVSLPLARVLDLKIGEIVTLSRAGIDRIHFEGLDGRALAEGKLGQHRGMRAIRLAPSDSGQNAAFRRPNSSTIVQAVMPEPAKQSA